MVCISLNTLSAVVVTIFKGEFRRTVIVLKIDSHRHSYESIRNHRRPNDETDGYIARTGLN